VYSLAFVSSWFFFTVICSLVDPQDLPDKELNNTQMQYPADAVNGDEQEDEDQDDEDDGGAVAGPRVMAHVDLAKTVCA
jgi:hypothetical protein